jgi:hypothetical protein
MSDIHSNSGNIGFQQQQHPSIVIFKKFVNGESTKQEAIDAFLEYITNGVRGIPLPNIELAKSTLNSDTAHTFMGYPQLLQCMAIVLKNS